MVGPDARRFLQHFRDIFAELRELLVSKVGELVAAAWIARKTSTLKELDVVCHYTRAVRMLKTEEKAALKSACKVYPDWLFPVVKSCLRRSTALKSNYADCRKVWHYWRFW